MRRAGAVLATAVATLAATPAASASFIVARDANNVSLRVRGTHAVVNYRTGGGARYAEVWGAIGARVPNPLLPQVAFQRRYGTGSLAGGSCRRYEGPTLPDLVAACTTRDGSY